jgi:hypothetical protein
VVVVVVDVTCVVGVGGGGAETTCDSGSVTQPARSARMPQQARPGISRLAVSAVAVGDRKLCVDEFIGEIIRVGHCIRYGA